MQEWQWVVWWCCQSHCQFAWRHAGPDFAGSVDSLVVFLSGWRGGVLVNKSWRWRWRCREILNRNLVIVELEGPEVDGLDRFNWVDLDLGKLGIEIFEGFGGVIAEEGTEGRGLHSKGVWI